MITRKNRFHGRGSIKRLYNKSKSVRTGVLALRYAPNAQRNTYRLAVVVSRKVSKSAVVRNRIRRRIYENVRILSSKFTEPHDLVVLVYDEKIADLAPKVLAKEIDMLFKKAKVTSADAAQHAIVKA